ncbi:MAG: hypothetical protein EAZ78_24655 [Oscillatoriales cyanobacterium]|uniref:COP23 domain-containing protein n=1 Tax=Microcoleus anatoxicus TaxID=2705319 RepID=UPI0029746CC3|nr:MAG: hypothetical protein EA000_04340 [Oscillatoriales cyanobacterium]TAE03597.1 MAG: hypothetical protein EAZ96_12380 [Oscillatoriales cyanobacterium]TAE98157.1 MAG: hypothetical protein EAZ78_24655 [Oscillatoriales cyanobacterium]TAF61981.1 MAG: hypothetical protein EAZ59_24795 [Oscillatoriales cyanobacterium]
MKNWQSISLVTASVVGLASAILPTTLTQAQTQTQSEYSFVCKKESGGVWTTFYESPRGLKAYIRWTSDFGGAVGYTPERRCREVSQRLNNHLRTQNPFYLTHGKQDAYPIICVTDFEGGGCKERGLVYTLDPNGKRRPDEVIIDLVNLAGNDFDGIPITATGCRLYVNVRQQLQGLKKPAKYICR